MLCGIYADPHLTKNMRTLQSHWDVTANKSIYYMYDKFDELNVESVICLGDFFDAPRIEAKHMQLVLPILKHINERTYPTYMLLGNHEIDSDDSNILDFLSMYDNIIPITDLSKVEDLVFIPYNMNPTEVDFISDNIVFTHHDIYGSSLAAGKTKAFFGLDTSVFKDARLVMNGHVHVKSKPASNIINAGSLLVSQQGELRVGDYPSYYVLDTKTAELKEFENKYSMVFLTIEETEVNKITSRYSSDSLVLRVEYEGDIPKTFIQTVHTSWRKKIESIDTSNVEDRVSDVNFDMKNYLTEYIKRDQEVSDNDKLDYINTGLEMLE